MNEELASATVKQGGKTSCHNPCRRIPKLLEENKHTSTHDTQVTERHSTGQVHGHFPTELLLLKSVTSTTNNSAIPDSFRLLTEPPKNLDSG